MLLETAGAGEMLGTLLKETKGISELSWLLFFKLGFTVKAKM